jgi:hypothetical protein
MAEVRILQAGLAEDEKGEIVIRGVLDQECLKLLNMAWYQREKGFSESHTNELIASYFGGEQMADVVVGMRGQRTRSVKDIYFLQDKCYCIDGGQRIYAASLALKERPGLILRIGVKVYTNTTEESENKMFCKLGTTQVKISPSILLRNKRKESPAAALLWAVSKDPEFALKDRVGWDQRKTRHELMNGFTFARIIAVLHSHQVVGLKSTKVFELLASLDALIDKIGETHVRTNIIRFFDVIDKCWSLRLIGSGRSVACPQLRPLFLATIAIIFSRYPEFWDGTPRAEFYCGDRFVRKLKTFTLNKYLNQNKVMTKDVFFEVLRKHLGLDPGKASEEAESAA